MDSSYKVILCGTGFKESIISGLLAYHKYKTLHIDVNDYYGGSCASLSLDGLAALFPGTKLDFTPEEMCCRYWNIDLVSKFIMGDGELTKMLIKTRVKDYMQFLGIDGCFVYQPQKDGWFLKGGKLHRVPANETQVLSSTLVPITAKLKGRGFFIFVAQLNVNDTKTWSNLPLDRMTMRECYEHFGIDSNMQDFIGHAIALEHNDDYLDRPCLQTIERLRLYVRSLLKFGGSPFIYPVYGLSCLAEGFSRMCAVNGGTFLLRAELEKILVDGNRVTGIRLNDGKIVNCEKLVCGMDYLRYFDNPPQLVERSRVLRLIIVARSAPRETAGCESCQVIFPQKQLGRKNDVYMVILGPQMKVCPAPYRLITISTIVETDDPLAEIAEVRKLVEDVLVEFPMYSTLYDIANNPYENLFITENYDPSSHFEIATEEVLRLYKLITGSDPNLTLAEGD